MSTTADQDAPAIFQAVDLLKQALIQDLAISPDGATVVYARRIIVDGKYRKHLWRVPYTGGAPEQLTSAEANDGAPRFSPDGRSLLFLSDRGGKSQPWVMSLAGGEPRQLATFSSHVRAAEWSPDGTRVLALAPSGEQRFIVGDPDDPTARRITDFTWRLDGLGFRDQFTSAYVVSAAGGEPVRLTEPSYEVVQALWSPDGDRIAFVADRRPEAGLQERPQLWSLPADAPGATPAQLATLQGSVDGVTWSPSGVLAIFGVDHPRRPFWANLNLYVVEGTGTRQLGSALDRPIANATFGDLIDPAGGSPPAWLDGENLVAIVGDQGASHPYRFGTGANGAVERLAGGEFVCTSIAAGGGHVVAVATDRGRAGEVYAVENGTLRQLTSHGSEWLEPYRRDPERVRIPHPDGHTIDAWFIPARGNPRPGPLAIQIHGGPHGSHGPTPWLEMLALADACYHVIYPNPRGSAGYGESFASVIHGNWGDPDGSDNMRVVEWAIEQGIADPKRVGVFGLSGGGYMTNWLLGHYPGAFAAAVSENPVTDMVSWYGGTDMATITDDRFMGVGVVPENIDAFLKRSPYFEIHRNEAPLLLLQCEQDLRCPPVQTELVFAILRSRGRPVEMVRYPGEPHYLCGIGRPDRRVDRMERIVEWFRRYL